MKNYTYQDLKTKTYYTNIVGLRFYPLEREKELEMSVKKGDIYWWKWLGIIPIIPIKAKQDLFRIKRQGSAYFFEDSFGFDTLLSPRYASLEKIKCNSWGSKLIKSDGIYKKPYIKILKEGGDYEIEYFENNEEAYEYIELMRKRCKEYGNTFLCYTRRW